MSDSGHDQPIRGQSQRAAPSQTNDRALPRLLSLRDAAAEMGMSPWTLRDLIGSGSIRAVQPPGVRRILIDRKDLERAIEAWKA